MGRWTNHVKTLRPCGNDKCDRQIYHRKYCDKCRARLKNHGDVNAPSNFRTYFFNEDFISNQTKESCWFIGWICSDGNIPTVNGILKGAVRMEICDKEILERIAELIGYKGPITESPLRNGFGGFQQKKPKFSINLCSVKMANDFIKIGVTPNKSKTIQLPKIQENLFYHFLRGEFEGDGCCYTEKGSITLSFYSASRIFLEQIAEKVGLKHHIATGTRAFALRYCSKDARELCERMYKDSDGIRLERKYKKYVEHLEYLVNKNLSASNSVEQ